MVFPLPESGVLILDGGLATELEMRGYDVSGPLWSARLLLENPSAIEQVHYDYFAAGADCVISASYQASAGGFAKLGLDAERTNDLLRLSVASAQSARKRYQRDLKQSQTSDSEVLIRPLYVAASIGPFGATLHDGSEYHGNYSLSVSELTDFHSERFAVLADSGADFLACETIPSLDEAQVLINQLHRHPNKLAWISFTSLDGINTAHGEPLGECASVVDSVANVIAVGVNCLAPHHVITAIEELRKGTQKPIVVYPNSGERWDGAEHCWQGTAEHMTLAEQAQSWIDAGARLIGGCCRTTPADIAELAAVLR